MSVHEFREINFDYKNINDMIKQLMVAHSRNSEECGICLKVSCLWFATCLVCHMVTVTTNSTATVSDITKASSVPAVKSSDNALSLLGGYSDDDDDDDQ